MTVFELISELVALTSEPHADVVIYTTGGDEFQFDVDRTGRGIGTTIRLQCSDIVSRADYDDVVSALATAKRELEELNRELDQPCS